MIYKDSVAHLDAEAIPFPREDANGKDALCINCNKDLSQHFGWGCNGITSFSYRPFSQTTDKNRYLTQSMKDSIYPQQQQASPPPIHWAAKLKNQIQNSSSSMYPAWPGIDYLNEALIEGMESLKGSNKPEKEVAIDLTDWRTWRDATKVSHECACGIHRSDCSYHKY